MYNTQTSQLKKQKWITYNVVCVLMCFLTKMEVNFFQIH